MLRGPIVAVIDPDHVEDSSLSLVSIGMWLSLSWPKRCPFGEVGLAPSVGCSFDAVRPDALAALKAGLHLASGLHTRLAEDPELKAARRADRWIWDLRQRASSSCRWPRPVPRLSTVHRLLAVGTDMAVGKMSACLELLAAAKQRSLPALFRRHRSGRHPDRGRGCSRCRTR